MNVMEAIWTLLELDTAGLAAEESGAGGRVGDGEAVRVLGTAQVLAQPYSTYTASQMERYNSTKYQPILKLHHR